MPCFLKIYGFTSESVHLTVAARCHVALTHLFYFWVNFGQLVFRRVHD